jgi:hypothetical protein
VIDWKYRPQFAADQRIRVLPARITVKLIARRYNSSSWLDYSILGHKKEKDKEILTFPA